MPTSIISNTDDIDNEDYYGDTMQIIPSTTVPTVVQSTFSPYKISLYVLRQSNPNESWKIQALFGDDLKYVFDIIATLARPG
ncbi:unnamed protein product, partial [Rotaria sp. Silwood2]